VARAVAFERGAPFWSTWRENFLTLWLEFFGGAVSVSNVVVLYARDDSLDFSDGYSGTISNALIIHYRTDGNRCIEGDNISEDRAQNEPLDTAPQSGPGLLSYAIAANPGTVRSITLTIAGQPVAVTQNGALPLTPMNLRVVREP